MKKMIAAFLITCLVSLAFISVVSAQSEELTLSLSRDFGYGGFNGDIQGTFSVKAKGPANLDRVQFFLDETLLGEDTEAPFAIQFVTDNYPNGAHVLSAVGYTADGKQLKSQTISALFVSKQEGGLAAIKMIVPILAVVFGSMAIAAITNVVNIRKGKKLPAGAARSYTYGGGICPKCKRPFGFQLLGINVIAGKLTPCPHCGKWSIVKRAFMSDLHAAEQAELDTEKVQISGASEEEQLRKELDDSRYQNL
jgi:hypothetical protein